MNELNNSVSISPRVAARSAVSNSQVTRLGFVTKGARMYFVGGKIVERPSNAVNHFGLPADKTVFGIN